MLKQILQFTQHPVYEEDENQDVYYRLSILGKCVVWALAFSFTFAMALSIVERLFDLNFGAHASEGLLKNYTTIGIFCIIVIVAPVLEELIFRAPLYWFQKRTALRIALYLSIFLFGLIHLFNFEDYTTYWWMTPLLIAPQLSLGMFSGFIRVRFGLLWAMGLHATYNLVLISPLMIANILNIPIE